jgi:hypothetical protein
MDWTWLLLLACPIMMVLMMFGMMRGGHGHGHGNHDSINTSAKEE